MKETINPIDTTLSEPQFEIDRIPSIKLSTKPQLIVCFPIGDKKEYVVHECPKDLGGCGKRWAESGLRIPMMVPWHLMMRHMNVQLPTNITTTYLAEGSRLSPEARNLMTKRCLELEPKYIMYWDDDTLPPLGGIFTLYNDMERHPEWGAVSGAYVSRTEPCEPFVYKEHGKGAYWDFPMGPHAWPVPILGAGAGFLLARVEAVRDVYDKINEDGKLIGTPDEVPIWADSLCMPSDEEQKKRSPLDLRGIRWGHDMRFCRLLNEHGWPVYVDGRVMCDHLDIASGKIFRMPEDAPWYKIAMEGNGPNINTADYWDMLYSKEGLDTPRQYPEMFQKIEDIVYNLYEERLRLDLQTEVIELGCGVGVLGSRLTARVPILYKGYDISPHAIEICKQRFLNAEILDIDDLQADMDHLKGVNCIIAAEILEHLDEDILHQTLANIACSKISTFIFTVPDNCMGPKEMPEHTALWNEEMIREKVKFMTDDGWSLEIEKADQIHLICVMRRDGS